ncbi:hypothetical protein GCM10017620_33500 [Brevundimonas intermedia]|uniref:Uncharacterized protein n=1 Tax=Brevundimonas intermedia TaxID=74315 RepID=A0ABQ5TCS8_9CAUL|nr:hypothetical protein GCM10017620_33500 [Brevundimonas intermedia]
MAGAAGFGVCGWGGDEGGRQQGEAEEGRAHGRAPEDRAGQAGEGRHDLPDRPRRICDEGVTGPYQMEGRRLAKLS